VSWKDRKPVVAELRKIDRAADAEAGRKALEAFEHGSWGCKYAAIWRSTMKAIRSAALAAIAVAISVSA
jgi:transposase-like protein